MFLPSLRHIVTIIIIATIVIILLHGDDDHHHFDSLLLLLFDRVGSSDRAASWLRMVGTKRNEEPALTVRLHVPSTAACVSVSAQPNYRICMYMPYVADRTCLRSAPSVLCYSSLCAEHVWIWSVRAERVYDDRCWCLFMCMHVPCNMPVCLIVPANKRPRQSVSKLSLNQTHAYFAQLIPLSVKSIYQKKKRIKTLSTFEHTIFVECITKQKLLRSRSHINERIYSVLIVCFFFLYFCGTKSRARAHA